jgi:phosphate-selective porin OprO/OprP
MQRSVTTLALIGLLSLGQSVFAQESTVDSNASSNAEVPVDTSAAAQLAALQDRIAVLERLNEIAEEDKASKAPTSTKVQADDRGFGLSGANDAYRLRIRGFAQTVGFFYPTDSANALTDRFLVRRLRPALQGSYGKEINWLVQPDFAGSAFTLLDAYLDWKPLEWLTLRGGKFKAPVGLERLQSPSRLTFVDRGLPTSFAPNRDIGFQVTFAAGEFGTLEVALLNGVNDGGSSVEDNNDNKDVSARLFLTPFKTSSVYSLQGLGLGVAVTYGDREGTPASYRTSGQQTFFAPTTSVDANRKWLGVQSDEAAWRVSPQAYWSFGRFTALGEYVLTREEWSRVRSDNTPVYYGVAPTPVYAQSWQGALSVFLTDTEADYWSGAKVKNNAWNPKESKFGALELAARIQGAQIDENVFKFGFADSLRQSRKVIAYTGGVNWFINSNVKLVLNYERTNFTGGRSAKVDKVDASGNVVKDAKTGKTVQVDKVFDRRAEDLVALSFNFSY